MKKYGELLPSYLNGQNIQKHSAILDEQNWKLYEKLYMLENWSNLNRPILFERVQTEPMIASVTVHVHSPFPIKKITIKKGYPTPYNTVTVAYDEDDCVTEYEYTYTEGNNESVNVLPYCMVTVETFDGITYEKGYPENDEPEGTLYDHDEYLDIIGNLLGLPRRRYKEVVTGGQDPAEYTGLYPSYFTKVCVPGHDHHIGDLLTEDDWYYMARLKHFSDNVRQGNLLKLMAECLYEMQDAKTFNMVGRTTITEETRELIGNNVLGLVKQTNYRNMDYTNQNDVLSQYIPVTRMLVVLSACESEISNYGVLNAYPNGVVTQTEVLYTDDDYEHEYPLVNAPVKATLTLDGKVIADTRLTDDNGEVYNYIAGLPPGSYSGTLEVEYDEPYEISGSNYETNVSFTVGTNADISTDSWKYGKYQSTSASSITAPSMEGALLDAGLGCACYTPIISSLYIDDVFDAYTISCDFYFTGGTQFIALGRVSGYGGNNNIVVLKDATRIYPGDYEAHDSSISTQHNVTWKILNKVCYLYYDGIYTGIHHDYSSGVSARLNVCAYNVRAITRGVKIESVTVDDSVDISTAPTGRLDVLDTYTIDKWAKIQGSSTNTPPSTSSDGYDCGRNFYNVFEDYILPKATTNKTVEIEFTTDSSSFRLGLVRYSGTGNPSWNSSYFDQNQATVSTGTHILKFIADNNGEWTTYLDDTRTSTGAFTLPNNSKLGAIQYTNGKYVKILGVRVYDNNE